MRTTEKAKEIRNELKTMGYTSKDISVRSDGSSVDIYIKNIDIDSDEIKDACRKYENVSRCEATGEILSGGNIFVFVKYDNEILWKYSDELKPLAQTILENYKDGDCFYTDHRCTMFLLDSGYGMEMKIKYKNDDDRDDERFGAYNVNALAESLVLAHSKINGIILSIENFINYEHNKDHTCSISEKMVFEHFA